MRRFIAFAVLLVLAACRSQPLPPPEGEAAAAPPKAAEKKAPGTVILGGEKGFGPAPQFVFHRYDGDRKTLIGKPVTAAPFHAKPRYETAGGLAFAVLTLEPGDYVLSSVVYRIDAYPVRNVNIHCMDQGAHRLTVEPAGVYYLGNFATDVQARAFVHTPGDMGHVRNLLRNFPAIRGEPVAVPPELVDFIHDVDCAGVKK